MKRQPDDLEISILALFESEPLNRHGAHRVDDILKQMSANSISYDDLTTMLSDMIHAGWLVGRTLSGPGGVAADIVDMDITEEGEQVLEKSRSVGRRDQLAGSGSSDQNNPSLDSRVPKCFISYSWDSDDHKAWVRKLAEALRSNGVYSILDQWDEIPGNDLPRFMDQAGTTDFVLAVCSPRFMIQAYAVGSGANYERRIISEQLMHESPLGGRVIPVLRCGGEVAIPAFLRGLVWMDFSVDADFDGQLEVLLRAIFKEPECIPPPLGPVPAFQTAPAVYLPSSPHQENRLDPVDTPSVPYRESSQQFSDPIAALQLHYQEQPFYAIWAWASTTTDDFIGTQTSQVREILKKPPGRGRAGFTLDYSISKASIVQEGLRFSSAHEGYELTDTGAMMFSRSLDGMLLGESTPAHTLHPLPLIEYTLSFVQLYLMLWLVNHAQDSFMGSLMGSLLSFNARLCLCNAVGWELRPGSPGTEGYGGLYDKFGPRRPLASARVLAPSTGPITIGIGDNPSQPTMALMQSVYSAFGYAIEDIPYFDPERLAFKF